MVLFVKPSDHNPPKTKNEKSEDGVTRFRMKIDFLEKRGNGKCFRHQSTRTMAGRPTMIKPTCPHSSNKRTRALCIVLFGIVLFHRVQQNIHRALSINIEDYAGNRGFLPVIGNDTTMEPLRPFLSLTTDHPVDESRNETVVERSLDRTSVCVPLPVGGRHNDTANTTLLRTLSFDLSKSRPSNASLASIESAPNQITRSNSTLTMPCLGLRGIYGKWVRDWEYAKSCTNRPRNKFSMFTDDVFRPTTEAPYRWETSWRWEDDYCPFQTLQSREDWCSIHERLGIRQTIIIGDSLSEAFFVTLVSMLGGQVAGHVEKMRKEVIQIRCEEQGFTLRYKYSRVDVDIHKEIDGSGTPRFLRKHRKARDLSTAFLFNIGAHMGKMDKPIQFPEATEKIWEWIKNNTRSNDIVFLRNSVPGHPQCFPQEPDNLWNYNWTKGTRVLPFESYDKFFPSMKEETAVKYGWWRFEQYNKVWEEAYVKRLECQKDEGDRPAATILPLNVFNMTVLRPDGHFGGDDCLHYLIPGPVDWWVHHLYSQLGDLADARGL